jgi:hypothetical protein
MRAQELRKNCNLTTLLQHVEDPQTSEHLQRAIRKLARYHVAAIELVSAAWKWPQLFSKINVSSVEMRKPPQLKSLEGKVHAEIQLLFFYELNSGGEDGRW